ncbi:MAG: hypothetical protein HY059_22915 [Proteobacteria bacterium]|nr:hypothetical protein [Pseudomonadota bacterium]
MRGQAIITGGALAVALALAPESQAALQLGNVPGGALEQLQLAAGPADGALPVSPKADDGGPCGDLEAFARLSPDLRKLALIVQAAAAGKDLGPGDYEWAAAKMDRLFSREMLHSQEGPFRRDAQQDAAKAIREIYGRVSPQQMRQLLNDPQIKRIVAQSAQSQLATWAGTGSVMRFRLELSRPTPPEHQGEAQLSEHEIRMINSLIQEIKAGRVVAFQDVANAKAAIARVASTAALIKAGQKLADELTAETEEAFRLRTPTQEQRDQFATMIKRDVRALEEKLAMQYGTVKYYLDLARAR